MTIVAILGAIFTALLVVLFKMQQAANATRDIADAAQDMHGLFRRWSWKRKLNSDPLRTIADPREAAIIVMTAVAEGDGKLSDRERDVILAEAGRHFQATSKQGKELLAEARFLLRDRRDLADVMRLMTPMFRQRLTEGERGDLIAMLKSVAAADGPADPTVAADIANFAHSLRHP